MRFIINASNLKTTGVIQVATSFIYECKKFKRHEYFVFTSNSLKAQLDFSDFPHNFSFFLITKHPFYGISGFRIRRTLDRLEKEIAPDCVFTVFGPSWWTPKSPHLMGYAIAHNLYPESPLFNVISVVKKLRLHLLKEFHRYFFKRNGQYYVCENEDTSERLVKYLNCNKDNVFTVTNTFNAYFNSFSPLEKPLLKPRNQNEFRFVTLSSFVTHKNLTILNKVIPLLRKQMPERNVVFILTVDKLILERKISEEALKNIINLGRLPVAVCPEIYHECDALFLPTLMECFSANYPEAMKMRKPILTSDLPFSRAICQDAALYFNPVDPEDITQKMIELINNKDLQMSLIEKGEQRLASFDTAESRARKYLRICEVVSKNEKIFQSDLNES